MKPEIYYQYMPSEKVYDGDTMIWNAPLEQYKFYIEKVPYKLKTYSDKYCMITITIRDKIGVELASIQTNELQIVLLIESIVRYLQNIVHFGYTTGDGVAGFIYPLRCGTDSFVFNIEVDTVFYLTTPEVEYKESLRYDTKSDQLRDLLFSVNRYNNNYIDILVPIMNTPVSFCDIYELVDCLSGVISDIDLSDEAKFIYDSAEKIWEELLDI